MDRVVANGCRLVEHNVIDLGGDWLALVSRRNSGWAVLDSAGYRALRVAMQARPLPKTALDDYKALADLWRSGLVEVDGFTCSELGSAEGRPNRYTHPSNVLIKLTDACNFQCTYCYDHKSYGSGNNLPLDKARETLSFVLDGAGHENLVISFHGGEPLLHFKRIKELVAHVESRRRPEQRVAYSIQTNGTLFTPAVVEFLDQHAFSVGVSLDGHSQVANQFRIGKDGQSPWDAFLQLLHDHPDFVRRRCGVMAVISNASIEGLPDFALWLQEQGVTSLALVLLQSMGRGRDIDLNQVSAAQVLALYDNIIAYVEQGRLRTLFVRNLISCLGNFLYFAEGDICYRGVCMASTRFLVLTPEGSFKSCDCAASDDFFLGRDLCTATQAQHPKRMAIRDRSLRLGASHAQCSRCEVFGLCGGGCAARASTNVGDFHGIDPVECTLFKHLYRKLLHDYAHGKSALFQYFSAYEQQ